MRRNGRTALSTPALESPCTKWLGATLEVAQSLSKCLSEGVRPNKSAQSKPSQLVYAEREAPRLPVRTQLLGIPNLPDPPLSLTPVKGGHGRHNV